MSIHRDVTIGPWGSDTEDTAPRCTALDLNGSRCGTHPCRQVAEHGRQWAGDSACATVGHLELVLAEMHGRREVRRAWADSDPTRADHETTEVQA